MADKPDKDQKTEKPTPKRKKEARQEGQIAKSPDIAGWIIVLVATYVLPDTLGKLQVAFDAMFVGVERVARQPDPRVAVEILGTAFVDSLVAIAPLLGVCAVTGLVTTLAQVGFVLSGKALKPKAERLNPLAGIKRLFSVRSLWETLKSFAKFLIIVAVSVPAVISITRDLLGGQQLSMTATLAYVGEQTLSAVRLAAFVALVLAFADWAYQYRTISKQLMMTKAEMKQEMKNSEGDPMVKGKIRALQRAASRNRMLAAVGDANVLIMNPTHFAVALRYEPGTGAPRVVAKGRDHLALRIRDRAQEAGVPVIEAPPLARALYKACEIDEEIPSRLFTGVAHVLAFVHRLNGRTSLSGVFVLPDVPVGDEEEVAA